MPKIASEAAKNWFETVILASCRLLMKTLYGDLLSKQKKKKKNWLLQE